MAHRELPIINYNSIKINNTDVSLSSICKASFNSPYNRIDIKMTPTNTSLSYYEARVTQENEDYGIGIGKLAYWDTNIANNKLYPFSINVNSTNFSHGNGIYRISLYAKSATNDTWDATYLVFNISGLQLQLLDADGVEIITTEEAPTSSETQVFTLSNGDIFTLNNGDTFTVMEEN